MNYQLKVADDLKGVMDMVKNAPKQPEGVSFEAFRREFLIQSAASIKVSSNDKVKVEDNYFDNSDKVSIQIRTFSPKNTSSTVPLIYWIHGGGTISGLPEQDDPIMLKLCEDTGAVVTSVNYRLSPEHPYPKPINDCYEGLLYVVKNASKFNIDPNKIIVGGGSAGGLLATSVAIKARNEKGPSILLQILKYPMVDCNDTSQSNKEINDIGIWDSWMNHYAYECYLKGVPKEEYKKAVPMMVEDLTGLPKAFITVGTMDCLRDEGIEYAQKLAKSGVDVELSIYPGMVHVFDELAPTIKESQDYLQARLDAIQRALTIPK